MAAENTHMETYEHDRIGTRRVMIDAAAQVLVHGGLTDFKVETLLEIAQVSSRTFYREFGSKDGLLIAVLEHELMRIAAEIADGHDSTAPVADRFWSYIDAVIDVGLDAEYSKTAAILSEEIRRLRTRFGSSIERCRATLVSPLTEILARGAASGTATVSDPAADARVVLSVIGSAIFDGPEVSPEAIRPYLATVIVPFIGRAFGLSPPAAGLQSLSSR